MNVDLCCLVNRDWTVTINGVVTHYCNDHYQEKTGAIYRETLKSSSYSIWRNGNWYREGLTNK